MESCCRVLAAAPNFYLDNLDVFYRYVRLLALHLLSLEPLAHRRKVANLSLFYRYELGRISYIRNLRKRVALPVITAIAL